MVRSARSVVTQQSSGRACDCQARAECYNAAVGRGLVCAQCCNEVLAMVRRAITKQSSGCGSHGQACAQCQGEAVVRACYAGLQEKCTPLSAVSGPLAKPCCRVNGHPTG